MTNFPNNYSDCHPGEGRGLGRTSCLRKKVSLFWVPAFAGMTSWFLFLTCIFLPNTALAFTVVELKEAAFSYRPAAEAEYMIEAPSIHPTPEGKPDTKKQFETYRSLEEESKGDLDLKLWSKRNGPAPQQFRIRIKAKNYGNEASKGTNIAITLELKMGEYMVNSGTWLVDEAHLRETAEWSPYLKFNGKIPSLAPTESYMYYSQPIPFGDYLSQLKGQYPVAMRARIHFHKDTEDKIIQIPIYPPRFAMDALNGE